MIKISNILKKLNLEAKGAWDNNFYVIQLEDSNAYAKMYTKLDKAAVNTEYPNFGKNSSNSTTKITNYFEVEVDNVTYNIFLIADFLNGRYYVKIGEQ